MEFGSSYRDCDLLVTESVLSVEREQYKEQYNREQR